jgi:putative endonuclease
MDECYAYILKSTKDGKYYYGSTKNINKRIQKHNSGGVPSTKHRRPLTLHYKEEFKTYSEALKRELFFKSIDGYNWLKQNKII